MHQDLVHINMKRRATLTKFVIDSWAWIEYFTGSESGKKAKTIIENPENHIITHWINISEVVSISKRKEKDYKTISETLLSISEIFVGDNDFAVFVGQKHAEIKAKIKDFGLIDACVLATAEKTGAKIITGDPHFKGMKNVVML